MPSGPPQVYTVDTRVRHIVLHYHLFKNAGTTIDQILEKNFGSTFVYLHGRRHDSTVTNDDLLRFLREHREIRAISSHHLRPPKPESEEIVFFDVIFLRHPLDRLRSMYDFYRRSEENDDPLVESAHRLHMAGFMQLLLARYPHLANDAQVNCLSNAARYTRPPDATDLQKATRLVARAAVPGVTEMFELSMRAAKYYLYPAFGSLHMAHPAENVSLGRDNTLRDRLLHMKEGCGEKLYKALLEVNALDLQLLDRAEAEVRRRLARIAEPAGVGPERVTDGVEPGKPTIATESG